MKSSVAELCRQIIHRVPADGSTVGRIGLHRRLSTELGEVPGESYEQAIAELTQRGILGKGRGRGGSVYLQTSVAEAEAALKAEDGMDGAKPAPELTLEQPESRPEPAPGAEKAGGKNRQPRPSRGDEPVQVLSYRHDEKRANNPPVGMVDATSDGVEEEAVWSYDPHLDPELRFDSSATRARVERLIDEALASGDQAQMKDALEELKRLQAPYLQWTGKAERTSFEVDTVSLHVHERIDPATILAAVQKRLRDSKGKAAPTLQPDLFHAPFENLPLRDAIDFYKHERDWSNRLIAGDSLLVMNSMLQKEGMAGQVQMIYIDPPYGIKYGSNFQPFTNKRDVKDRKDEDLTQEPEMIKAFRDTWELGIHSYLTYLRDRLLLARELLGESGSVFVQISDENLHHVRELMDEVFGSENFCRLITVTKTAGFGATLFPVTQDYLVWYAKDVSVVKFRQLYASKSGVVGGEDFGNYKKFDYGGRYRIDNLTGQNNNVSSCLFGYNYRGVVYSTPSTRQWKTTVSGMESLSKADRLESSGAGIYYKRYFDDFPLRPITDKWSDTGSGGFADDKLYVVQTGAKVVERCLLMTSDPGDLILDPTCGSGTTAQVAEKWGRRWITCDTSRVAVTLAKQRLMTASYNYFELKYPQEGLRGGFIYKTVPHITLKSIANNPEIDEIYERDHPAIEQPLADLNHALKGKAPAFSVPCGGRKGQTVDFSAPDTETITLPAGDEVPVNALLEWEVPFDFPEAWPEAARAPFEAFHAARQTMQQRMDESIANHAGQEVLYDQPEVSKNKQRITGPFTVEAVPFATVLGLDEAEQPTEADVAVARSGATSRHVLWREELLKAGIRGKGGQQLKLMDLETLPGTQYLHAVGTLAETGERVAVSFGPEYAALEQRQVEIAKNEAGDLFPLPKLLVFCAFTFDPEAAKDIDSIKGIQALRVQMNTDLLTEDLKKNARSNESFWLMGQPDVEVRELRDGKLQVEVHGFDYFDTKSGELKSGGKRDIAVWELDTDYDDRSLYPRQVFFPMAGKKDGWHKLRKDIRAELNEELLEQLHGTRSLSFEPGENRSIAVKIVDNRGIESLKVIRLD
ncbi:MULTISPECIES: site-specific DNA-methyltransferase [unclassified Thioalkalivibrio]|uniref:site-specific DNA-methyltransferase n=1 Tax=unclassified Thioalkalivibrio TaxID=2621013 RepID=UPI000368B995|nr:MULTISPECIES: site-specific DNA-methyltransferase [unclassified Thioalkalivibrio]